MFGLVVLIAVLLYLSLLVWATWRGWRWGVEKKGWRGKKRMLGAAIGFLVIYLPVFWDWIPTVAVHKYYCETESGFEVYKNLDQWKAENPGEMETLVASNNGVHKSVGDGQRYTDTYFLNSRFNWVVRKDGPFLFNRWRWEQELVDSKTNDVLARYVDFSTGDGHIGGEPQLRFWLHTDHCPNGNRNDSLMRQLRERFKGERK